MSSKSVSEKSCVLCDAAIKLEEKIRIIKSVVGKTCVWCFAAAIVALTLLAVTWVVIIVSS